VYDNNLYQIEARVRFLSEGTTMDDQEDLENEARIRLGKDGFLRMDGRPVKTEHHLALSWIQLVIAFMIALATLVSGLGSGVNDGFDFGCKQRWWTHGCPKADIE
jgi:hypothetical protein